MSLDSSAPSSRISSPSPVSTMSDTNTTTSVTTSSSASSQLPPFTGSSSSPSFEASVQNGIADATHPAQSQLVDVDPQIVEALRSKSKDRLYVLKLGEQMELLINDRRQRLELTPATSYQRLLVHRCSAYHRLTIENDPSSKTIAVITTSESRIPTRRLADLVPAEMNAQQPAFKIMRRSMQERRSKPHSQAGSVTGEDADLSDVEPSESGSLGGRSNTSKKHMTIEEREAAYNEARSRIFMDFEEKEKEKDMSASSSSLSLTSGSGDFEDSASSVAGESERSSSSFSRDRKDNRRPGSNSASSSASRSLRSPAAPFSSSGPASSHNSRAPSPSFTYATLYEPPSISYDPAAGPGFQPNQYMYPYPLPPGPSGTFMPPPFQYYPPYPYPSPPSQTPNSSDPTSPGTNSEMFSPPPVPYGNPYLWHSSHPHPHSHPQTMSAPNLPQSQGGPSPIQNSSPPPPMLTQQSPNTPYPQPPYMHQPMYPYPVTGYYTSQPNQPMPLPAPLMYDPMPPHHMNNNVNVNDDGGMTSPNNHHRRNGNQYNGNGNGGKGRNVQPPQPRHAWSFGPGVGMGGMTFNNGSSNSNGETVGPRLNSTRRLSNNSNGSNRNSSNWDEASSTASSSTSSSSRRTFTSTTSSTSQHPLPPRPDWAVGLKPDHTLHPTNNKHHHDHHGVIRSNATMPQQMSPRNPPKQRPPVLQANDFPPLSADAARRAPQIAGAWTNQSSTRSILSSPPPGNPLVYQPGGVSPMINVMTGIMVPPGAAMQSMPQVMNMTSRLDDPDRAFERPPPKGATELYNPKGPPPKRPASMNGRQNSQDKVKTPVGDVNGVTEQLFTVSIDDITERST